MSTGYTKLFSSIVTSTIWLEDDHTRIVWITMLALADKNGEVMASVPGLARVAGVPLEATRAALAKFLSPDPDSRSKEDEGRRIEVIEGGWSLLNHEKYREMASREEAAESHRERQRRYRAKLSRNEGGVTVTDSDASVTERDGDVMVTLHIADADTEADTKIRILSSSVLEVFEFWKAELNHTQAQLTPKRRSRISDRLKQGYSAETLKQAVLGCKASPFHRGENKDGKVFDDIELICRSGEKVEQFLACLPPVVETPVRSMPVDEDEGKERISYAEFKRRQAAGIL